MNRICSLHTVIEFAVDYTQSVPKKFIHIIHRYTCICVYIFFGTLCVFSAEQLNVILQLVKVQGIHKRVVRFQKVTMNLFLTLHGHNLNRQQRQLSKFLMRYQQFASHA